MRYHYLVFLLFALGSLRAQMHDGNFGPEWINYNQSYYKMELAQDGLYRISAQALQNAGINTASLPLSNLSIYHMGQEVPIQVESSGGQLQYIQFYGEKHRGELDKELYNNPNHHFNPTYSVITDTSAYFLTWSNTGQGRRYADQAANLSNLPAKEDYFMYKSVRPITTAWQKGKSYYIATEELTKSTFEYGEGWGGNPLLDQSHAVGISNLYTTGPAAQGEVRLYASGAVNHNIEVQVGGQSRFNTTFAGDSVGAHSFSVPLSNLLPTTIMRIRGLASSSDYLSASYVAISYPRTFDFGGANNFAFELAASNNRQYLEITNFDGGSGQNIYLYDFTNSLRIRCFWDGSRVLTDLPASAVDRKLLLINEGSTAIQTMGRLEEANFVDYSNLNADYIIVTHASLRQNSLGDDPVRAYADYRATTGYNPVIIEVDNIFDQFGYGINKHPVALRNLAGYCKQNWANPQYVFLIGKGRTYTQVRNFHTYDHLIPTFGFPPSDNLLMAPIGSDVPVIPVGRLAAVDGDQVSLYLNKVRDYENERLNAASDLSGRGWTKNVIHLGGGANSSEQNIIQQNLNNMETIISASQFGGNVTSFFKTSTNPIQAAQSFYLDSLINNGVSLITFFGHASPNSFDFNLDQPENYSNARRYPMFMSLGCYAGTVFEDGARISESFIFEENAGASVFLASVGAVSLSALNVFAGQYYYQASQNQYGQGAAKINQKTIEALENGTFYSTTVQMVSHYLLYHGDPAIQLSISERPDYYVDNSLVSHSPNTVTTQMADFELVVDVYNLGMAIDTSFWVEINREYPNGSSAFVSREHISAPNFHKELRLTVPVEGQLALGTNFFDITIDVDSEIDERPQPSAEQNNQVLRYPVQILSDAILPVYPQEFAIVPQQNINLKASTGNSMAQSQTYVLQIDTTAYFNSPLMQQTSISQGGGLLEWQPNMSYTDSTVYYWRVSPDSTNPTIGYSWATSSFIYIDASYSGWNQSHFFQFKRNQLNNLELDEPQRNFEFITSLQEITLANGFTPSPLHPDQLATYLNGNLVDKCRCHNNRGVYVQVIDSSDLTIWTLGGGQSQYGAVNCDAAGRTASVFLFETQQTSAALDLERFLADSIPDGYYVLVYTLNDANADNWPASLIGELQNQGAQQLPSLTAAVGGLPWAFFYQKNNASFPYRSEELGASQNDIIGLSCLMPGNWDKGSLLSTQIGPAQNWFSFHWEPANLDTNDVVSVDLYGIDTNGTHQLLLSDIVAQNTSLNSIDANQYPKLELIWKTEDEQSRSSGQLAYWRVLADLVPEAALRPERFSVIQYDTVDQGQPFGFNVQMENISPLDMDSILVKYQLLENDSTVNYKRLAPLPTGDSLRTGLLTVSTNNLSGAQQLLVEINPDNDQAEQYHFNNLALVNFFVRQDGINPLLDVTFDGVHIMNGDMVSGKSQVVVSLSDENKWLGLDDLEDFQLTLRHSSLPNGETQLTLNNDLVQNIEFLPADAQNLVVENKAQLILDLDLEFDGTYTLFVSATDRSGNNSGELDYSIDFEVINRPMISDFLNYPNPFTTQTQFVFTLTGRELPSYLKIQIMTVTGKIVREISMDELGPLHIGVNRTEFAWDGTDQFGDRLANGVYLYRILAKTADGESYERYLNKASSFTEQGFGKMYLMR